MTDRSFWNDRFANDGPAESEGPNEFLVELVSKLEPGRALDAGCGTGENAIWLAGKGWDVTAIDFSEVALRRARAHALAAGVEVHFVEADLRAIALEPAQYDLVVSAYLHFPADERRALLQKLALAARPGGTIFVIGHDRTNLEEGEGGPRDPAILYQVDEITQDLSPLALEIRRAQRVRRQFLDANGEAVAIDALVVATPARR